ncbi:uncharacterized protein BO95DRAFT_63896 [Aspergillus brunneoviolaceus CBS 621.78]|uniref:Uncharacterized protein n=1 Tax=Aspergillus brunneoviolaceus CBS 621.78 TaxID=1450534 RepID=A0ACD1GFK4_9EURO|nr:hypothetical protein BO95DRAFT_63896 [Aspergillus brunneoviolaceus CBS 621.78]RAH48006.1 hypothetical protein BO95DRAFT_63896 [Aspergillus brunneoviolaceus CBS 621.78]
MLHIACCMLHYICACRGADLPTLCLCIFFSCRVVDIGRRPGVSVAPILFSLLLVFCCLLWLEGGYWATIGQYAERRYPMRKAGLRIMGVDSGTYLLGEHN